MRERGKQLFARVLRGARTRLEAREIVVATIAILSLVASFGLGFFVARQGQRSALSEILPTTKGSAAAPAFAGAAALPAPPTPPPLPVGGQVVASKKGTRYYLPWCGGVRRISDANKVWFSSIKAAKVAGYTPAANCKGI